MQSRRTDYRQGKLRPERIQELESIPGWVWDPLEESYQRNLKAVEDYVAEYGTLPPKGTEFRGQKIGTWATARRNDYRQGKLSLESIQELESIQGWVWDPNDESYQQYLKAVRDYVTEYGVLPAKNTVFRGLKLASWVQDRRKDYRQGKLRPERIQEFESIPGWSWGLIEDSYRQYLAALRDYVSEYGVIPPKGTVFRGLNLGTWVQRQRSEYRQGKISPERIQDLEAIPGWRWKIP